MDYIYCSPCFSRLDLTSHPACLVHSSSRNSPAYIQHNSSPSCLTYSEQAARIVSHSPAPDSCCSSHTIPPLCMEKDGRCRLHKMPELYFIRLRHRFCFQSGTAQRLYRDISAMAADPSFVRLPPRVIQMFQHHSSIFAKYHIPVRHSLHNGYSHP